MPGSKFVAAVDFSPVPAAVGIDLDRSDGHRITRRLPQGREGGFGWLAHHHEAHIDDLYWGHPVGMVLKALVLPVESRLHGGYIAIGLQQRIDLEGLAAIAHVGGIQQSGLALKPLFLAQPR